MVAHDVGIVAEAVEHGKLHLATEHIEEHRALHRVAGIEQQHILFGTANAIHKGTAAQYSALICCIGHNLAVSIVS